MLHEFFNKQELTENMNITQELVQELILFNISVTTETTQQTPTFRIVFISVFGLLT